MTNPNWRAALAFALLASPLRAQLPGGPNLATRSELQDALTRSTGKNADLNNQLLRDRLTNGDFKVGDRIYIRVVGEQQLTDTFTVASGPELPLPQIGVIPLRGVLRSELSACVTAYLARYLREPVVQVRPLVRIMVEGNVARPGYYPMSPDLPLADAITTAGGLAQSADVNAIRVERGTTTIWGGRRLQEAMGQGYSIDQLNLQAGDRLVVPGKSGITPLQLLTVLVLVPSAIYTITHW